jgi:hypothetical protein
VHYENPGLHENIVDNSGLELHLSPVLREQDSSMLTIGHDVSTLHLVPPDQPSFTSVGKIISLYFNIRFRFDGFSNYQF